MNEPRTPDRLIAHIHRSDTTLAACERNVRSAYALLAAAHRRSSARAPFNVNSAI